MRDFDHLVIAARTLDDGVAWVERQLAVPMAAGGKHPLMATHNRLLSLGPGRFLEVIAIDPEAPPPGRPRWFELDTPALQARIARAPALVHWIERTDDIERELRDYGDRVDVLPVSRGKYRWRMGVRPDGAFPGNGRLPTLIQWDEGGHPADDLPPSGCALLAFDHGGARLRATFSTPSGLRTIVGGE